MSVNEIIRLLTIIVFSPVVNAHGFLSFPAAVYQDPYTATSFVTTITESINPSAFGGRKWNDSPELNAATFASAFHRSNFSSLREIVDLVVFDCGNTKDNTPPVDVTGATEAHWQNNEEHKGFVESHHGPCEVWIDDRLALHDDDCRAEFTTYPAFLPVSYNTLCKGECQLTFYWLALHEPAWQVYKACVPIVTKEICTHTRWWSQWKRGRVPMRIARLKE